MVEAGKKKMPVVLITIVIVVTVTGILAALLLMDGEGGPDKINAAEWNVEYARIYDNPDGVMQFPSYDDGDVIVIAGTITGVEVRHQNETAIIPFAFDYQIITLDGTQINGLEWESAAQTMINVGDHVEITLHIEDWSISSYTGETISEWDYNNVLPSSTIKNV